MIWWPRMMQSSPSSPQRKEPSTAPGSAPAPALFASRAPRPCPDTRRGHHALPCCRRPWQQRCGNAGSPQRSRHPSSDLLPSQLRRLRCGVLRRTKTPREWLCAGVTGVPPAPRVGRVPAGRGTCAPQRTEMYPGA